MQKNQSDWIPMEKVMH